MNSHTDRVNKRIHGPDRSGEVSVDAAPVCVPTRTVGTRGKLPGFGAKTGIQDLECPSCRGS